MIQVSDVSKVCSPACQLPCMATEVYSAGLSMLAAEKFMREPMARSQAPMMGALLGCDTCPLPRYMATARGPCRASTSCTFAATWSMARLESILAKFPSAWRCRQCVRRAGSLCCAGSARPLGQL